MSVWTSDELRCFLDSTSDHYLYALYLLAATKGIQEDRIGADAVVLVPDRLPEESLCKDLLAREQEWADQGLRSVRTLGDALSPSTIAAALWEGRRYAEELSLRENVGSVVVEGP